MRKQSGFASIILISLVVLVVVLIGAGVVVSRNDPNSKKASNSGCNNGYIPGRLFVEYDSNNSRSTIERVVQDSGGKVDGFAYGNAVYVNTSIGNEQSVISALKKHSEITSAVQESKPCLMEVNSN